MFCGAISWEGVCVWLYLLSVCVFSLPRVAAPGEDARRTGNKVTYYACMCKKEISTCMFIGISFQEAAFLLDS